MERYGIEVIRFLNRDIDDNFDGVCYVIDKTIKRRIEELPSQSAPQPAFSSADSVTSGSESPPDSHSTPSVSLRYPEWEPPSQSATQPAPPEWEPWESGSEPQISLALRERWRRRRRRGLTADHLQCQFIHFSCEIFVKNQVEQRALRT